MRICFLNFGFLTGIRLDLRGSIALALNQIARHFVSNRLPEAFARSLHNSKLKRHATQKSGTYTMAFYTYTAERNEPNSDPYA